jgi:excisionase family DNA binding protein
MACPIFPNDHFVPDDYFVVDVDIQMVTSLQNVMDGEVESLWTVNDLCVRLKIARSTVYAWVHEGRLPCVKLVGGIVRFQPSAIRAWVAQQSKPGRVHRVPEVEV